MSESIDVSVSEIVGPLYYRSFAFYELPFRPVEKIEFAETEGLRSYYLVYKDLADRVIRFDKKRIVQVEQEPRQLDLAEKSTPGKSIYFVLGQSGLPEGDPIAYPDMENWREQQYISDYYAGEIDSGGQTCTVVHLRVELVFRELYRYWSNNRLRERIEMVVGQPQSHEFFEEDGSPLAAVR